MITYRCDKAWEEMQADEKLLSFLTQEVLPEYLYRCRWFGGKSSQVQQVLVNQNIHLQHGFRHYYLLVLEVFFKESYAHNYFLPLAVNSVDHDLPAQAYLADLELSDGSYHLIDAVYDPGFHAALFHHLLSGKTLTHRHDQVFFKALVDLGDDSQFSSHLLSAEQSNSTIIIKDRFYLKIFRRLFRDKNPDFEMNEYLSQQGRFKHFPKLAGLIWWEPKPEFNISLGLMQEKVENEGDAWTWILEELEGIFNQMETKEYPFRKLPMISPLKLRELSPPLLEVPGRTFFRHIRTLAQRTAEMHLALGQERKDRSFVRISYNGDYTVWLKNRLIYQFDARYNLLNNKLASLPAAAKELAEEVMLRKDQIVNFILGFDEEALQSARIRIHGDYHLGQILKQGEDFYILDFEGEPESTIRDRKVKQSPLKDVAGLLRSFHYALHATLVKRDPAQAERDQQHAKILYQAISGVFLNTYFKLAFREQLNIGYRKEITYLLQYNLLEKAIYELGYELNGRPDWAIIPLRGILEITDEIKKL